MAQFGLSFRKVLISKRDEGRILS